MEDKKGKRGMNETYYFDMDGVLVDFDEVANVEKPFAVLGTRYFRTCAPNPGACELFEELRRTPGVTVKVLTRLWVEDPEDDAFLERLSDEQREDKFLWCVEHLGVRPEDFICLKQSPHKTGTLLRDAPDPAERGGRVLIDDDPRVLSEWTSAGGAGVQWLQPRRRVATWTGGPVVRQRTDADHPSVDDFTKGEYA